jgi:nucleotide-binding universal stress UspA family protein
MRVLLCIGGRIYGEYAAGFVGRLSRGMRVDCTVLYVNPEARTFRGQKFPTPKTKKEIEEFMERVVNILEEGGVEEVRTITRVGEPTREILQEAEKGYHMVVTGTRGARGLERHLFESVSSQVAEYADIPVMVVRKETAQHGRILVATDGSEASEEAVYCCGYLAKRQGFNVTVLSVSPTR